MLSPSRGPRRPSLRSALSLWVDAPEWLARWGVVAALFIIDAVWLADRKDGSALVSAYGIGSVLVLLSAASALAMLSFDLKRLSRPLYAASDIIDTIVYIFVLYVFLAPFASLMASLDFPLVDGALGRADELILGFDWSAASNWVAHHPFIDFVFTKAYFSMLSQAALILLIGSYARPGDRNAEAIWLFLIGVLTCIVLSGVLPALGHPGVIGMTHIEELRRIREGHWSAMSPGGGGIVTFPSFHAELAVIYIYCVRHYRWVRVCFVPLNIVMLVSTITVGGHYLVDVIAGVVVAFGSIALIRAIQRRYGHTPEKFATILVTKT